MCRTAGRRCENHWTPEQKAADNARRRAIYAARKGTLKAVETPLANNAIRHTVTSALNDYVTQTEIQCYAPETVSGHIDVSSLDENSYRDYGFVDPNETYGSTAGRIANIHRLPAMDYAEENSRQETEAFTHKERAAMTIYTGDAHREINLVYFDSPKARTFNRGDNNVHTSKFAPRHDYSYIAEDGERKRRSSQTFEEMIDRERGKLSGEHHINKYISQTLFDTVVDGAYSEESMREYTKELDSAFAKTSGKQRVVYRGESYDAEHHRDSGKSLIEHVQEEYPVGAKKLMKGVQSTSMNRDTAFNFGEAIRQEAIIYEIRSPSGVNITDLSTFDHEREVALPRNTQYIVVGSKMITAPKGHQVAIIQMIEVDDDNNIRTKDNLRTEFGDVNYERLRPKAKVV